MRRVLPLVILAACANGAGQPSTEDAPGAPPDAPGLPPDAAIDATQPVIDAMPIDAAIDAAPCTPVPQQVLGNGAFDAAPFGTGWTQLPQDPTYPPIVAEAQMPIPADTPSNAVWLGGLVSSDDALYQQIAIPAGASGLSISGMKWFASQETAPNLDLLRVEIRSTADQILETVITWDDTAVNSTWTPFTITPTGNYGGQTIRLYFESVTNATNNTNFWLDSLSFDLTACP